MFWYISSKSSWYYTHSWSEQWLTYLCFNLLDGVDDIFGIRDVFNRHFRVVFIEVELDISEFEVVASDSEGA